jgi:hypothetical protein
MQFERRFFGVVACAITLLGLSTSASASIIGTGCVVSGNAGQIAPSSVAAFTSECTGATVVSPGEYTFSAPDTLLLNLAGGATPNTGAELVSALGGMVLTGAAAAAFTPATSGSDGAGGDSTVWDLHETNIVPGTYTVTLMHDDGIVLLNGTSIVAGLSAPAPTDPTMSTGTFTVPSGGTVDLLYVECCGFPAHLAGTMPAEIPEPGVLTLTGAALLGVGILLRRKRASLN